ncbi:MAG: rare lipoprotein A [Arenicella sp.]|jgi:rare lipoprotein A
MSRKIFAILIPFLILSASGFAQKVGDKARGKASYYHSKFNGKKTASGEIYSASKMTCAHRTLPYGTMLKVTNRKNQKAVIVKVNDRGPFAKGRIVDLSFKAASKIDMIRDGIADVEIEIVTTSTEIEDEPIVKNTPKKEDPKVTKKDEKDKTVDVIKQTEKKVNDAKGVVGVVKKIFGSKKNKKEDGSKTVSTTSKKTTTSTTTTKKTGSSSTTPTKTGTSNASKFASGKTYSVWGTEMKPQGYGIQIASYVDVEDAIKIGKEAHELGLQPIFIQSGWANKKKVYRLIFGASATPKEAGKQIVKAKSKGFNGAFVKKHL